MYRAKEAVSHRLRHQGQVHVEEAWLAGVAPIAKFSVRLIGRAKADGIGLRQGAIERRSGGGSRQYADLEIAAGAVLAFGALCNRGGNHLRRAGRSESAKPNGLAVLNHGGRFVGGENWK